MRYTFILSGFVLLTSVCDSLAQNLSQVEQSMLKRWMCTYAYPGILPTKENFLLAVEDHQGEDAAMLRGKLQGMRFQFYSVKDTIYFVKDASVEQPIISLLKESISVDRSYCNNCPMDTPTKVVLRSGADEKLKHALLDSLDHWRMIYRNNLYQLPVYAYIKGLKRERISARLAFIKVEDSWTIDVLCGNPQVVQHLYFSRELIEKMEKMKAFQHVNRIELTYECVDNMEVFIPPWW